MLSDALQLSQYREARDRIANDSTLSEWQRAQLLAGFDQQAVSKPPDRPFTVADVFHGAIGAGLGYGLGAAASAVLGLSPSTASAVKGIGAGIGTFMNIKSAHERDLRMAVRIGFVKKAVELGMIKEGNDSPLIPKLMIPLTPDTFAAPVTGTLGAFNKGTGFVGSLAGNLDSADVGDRDLMKMEAERQALEAQEHELKARRANRLIGSLLARRNQGGAQIR